MLKRPALLQRATLARIRAAWMVVQGHSDRAEAQCREIIRSWVNSAVLWIDDEYDDPVDRKLRNGLRLDATKRPS